MARSISKGVIYQVIIAYIQQCVDLPRIELGSWQCECHVLPLNYRPVFGVSGQNRTAILGSGNPNSVR